MAKLAELPSATGSLVPVSFPSAKVAPIAAQVDRDALRTGLLGEACGLQRVGVADATRLAESRHVIDIDGESGLVRHEL